MRGERFEQAKAAAKAFLDSAPDDVHIGIVAFAGSVDVVQEPTLDRAAAAGVLDDLSLSLETRLTTESSPRRRPQATMARGAFWFCPTVADTSKTELQEVGGRSHGSEVRVDVVALGRPPQANAPLEAMASEGGGRVIAARSRRSDRAVQRGGGRARATGLGHRDSARRLRASEGSVAVSVDAGGETYTDTAFVSFGAAPQTSLEAAGPPPVKAPSLPFGKDSLIVGLAALGLGGLVVLLSALGVLGKRDKESVEQQIAAYTRAGAPGGSKSRTGGANHGSAPGGVTQSAVGFAQKALQSNSDFESKLGAKLDGAAVALKPAEWLLLHSGIAIGAALFGFLLSGGGIGLALTFLLLGAVGPWVYLGIRRSQRLKAFNGQLAETLQLISGSLSAGLSLAQSLDTVVREGNEPVAGEFRRALVEARLGVPIEDSLESIAKRMESADFEWIVMAIRIQREIGGNLAELLLKVAATMREREYLRRQVKTLSAEGKLSAYILGALPIGMFFYMLVANRDYVASPLHDVAGLDDARRRRAAHGSRLVLDESSREGGRLMSPLLMLVIGVGGIFAALFLSLTAMGVFTNEQRGVSKSLAVVEAFSAAPTAMQKELEPSFNDRVVTPLLGKLTGLGRRISPSDHAERIRKKLDIAGNPSGWTVERVEALKVVGIFGVGALAHPLRSPRRPRLRDPDRPGRRRSRRGLLRAEPLPLPEGR